MLNLVNWIFSRGFVDQPNINTCNTQTYDYKGIKSDKRELHAELIKYFIIKKLARETVNNIINEALDNHKINV